MENTTSRQSSATGWRRSSEREHKIDGPKMENFKHRPTVPDWETRLTQQSSLPPAELGGKTRLKRYIKKQKRPMVLIIQPVDGARVQTAARPWRTSEAPTRTSETPPGTSEAPLDLPLLLGRHYGDNLIVEFLVIFFILVGKVRVCGL